MVAHLGSAPLLVLCPDQLNPRIFRIARLETGHGADATKISTRDVPAISPITRPRPGLFQAGGVTEPYVSDTFAPIVLPGLSQDNVDVAQRLAPIPTMVELTARLGALPPEALASAVKAEPAIYERTIGDARDAAAYLRALADSFVILADRLQGVSR